MKKSTIVSLVISIISTLMVVFFGYVRSTVSAYVSKTYEFSYTRLVYVYIAVIFVLLFADIIISRNTVGVIHFSTKFLFAGIVLIVFGISFKAVMFTNDMYIYITSFFCFIAGGVIGALETRNAALSK